MAAVTNAVATGDTGLTPNTSGAFTPAVGDLLVAFVGAPNTLESPGVLTSSIAGNTFTQFRIALWGGGTDSLYGFVADQLIAAGEDISQTVTCTLTADQPTGTNIQVVRVAGMSRVGLAAIRQTAVHENQNGAATPAPTFAVAALTDNVTLGGLANNTNPAGRTEPAGWTEAAESGFTTPDNGTQVVFRDSGFTGTTITWGSTFGSNGCAMTVELDTSGDGGAAVKSRYYEMMRAS